MIWIYGDDNSDRKRFPIVTLLLIALNIYVFFFLQECGANTEFTYSLSTVPAEIVTGEDIIRDAQIVNDRPVAPPLYDTPVPVYLTLLTALFMHGGLFHLLGNMLFLFVFGDNVEDRLGKIKFLLFYLCCGAFASLGHIATVYIANGNPLVPLLGASGAISGVLGGYILYYPKKQIKMLFWLIIIPIRFRMPAFAVIGIWFVLQILNGLRGGGGNIAYGAHIVGFVSGMLLVMLLRNSSRQRRFYYNPPQ